ncbi:MAG: hypothetical protein ACHQ2Y_07985 [Candidatus Lutacidiplasmatales archaeon]
MGASASLRAPTHPSEPWVVLPRGTPARSLPEGTSFANPYVANTLVLANNTLVPGNLLAGNGIGPSAIAYDRAKGELFVADTNSNTVSVINDTTQKVVATVPVGIPEDLAYDSGRGEVFASNPGRNEVDVISDTSNKVVTVVPLGTAGRGAPYGVAYDSGTNEVFVTNSVWHGNVSVISDATDKVIATIAVGDSPQSIAYDNRTNELFVTNSGSNSVSVINDSSDRVVATIPGFSAPAVVAYDPANSELFVANFLSSTVTVVSDTNNSVLTSIPVGLGPFGIAYDSGSGDILVSVTGGILGGTPQNSGNESVINTSANEVVAQVGVGHDPFGLAYDAAKSEAYVANFASDTVSVTSIRSGTVVENITVGATPQNVAVDTGTGELFVTNYYTGDGLASDTVSVVSEATDTVAATIPVANGPHCVAYDPGTGEVFVGSDGPNYQGSLSVINDTTNVVVASVPTGANSYPAALAYDSGRGEMFVAEYGTNAVAVWSDSTNQRVATIPVGTQPTGIVYDPRMDELFVVNRFSGNVSVINDGSNSVVANISVGGQPSAIAYDSALGELFVTNGASNRVSVINETDNALLATVDAGGPSSDVAYDPQSGGVFVTLGNASGFVGEISGTPARLVATVAVGHGPMGVAVDERTGAIYVANQDQGTISILGTLGRYAVNFNESGLPPGTPWSVTLHGLSRNSTTSSISYTLTNGSFAFSVGPLSGYRSSPSYGNLTVQGADVRQSIEFTPLSSPMAHDLALVETGLPSGTEWSVLLNGSRLNSSGSIIHFSLPDGTFEFTPFADGYDATPASGSVTMNGTNQTLPVSFTAVRTYSIIFDESGLPAGTPWGVSIGGQTQGSRSAVAIFPSEPNGSYPFIVLPVAGYTSNTSGVAKVNGGNSTLAVLFSPQAYPVIIVELGLPGGTTWSVTIWNVTTGFNQTISSTSSLVIFFLPNGTYGIRVGVEPSYSLALSTAQFTVAGGPLETPTVQSTSGSSGAAGPALGVWPEIVLLTAAAAIVATLFLWERFRRPSAADRPSPGKRTQP